MNRDFRPTSAPIHALVAGAAVLATMLVFGAIAGLADHYNSASQLASVPRSVVAHR
jgi:hypothetical protein